MQTVATIHEGGHGEHGFFVGEDNFAQAGNSDGNGVEGSTLALDDLAAGIAHVRFDILDVLLAALIVVDADVRAVLGHDHAGDVGKRPGNDLAVAVLTDDVGVNALGRDVHVIGQQGAETGSIQHGAGAQHLRRRKIGALEDGVGDDINGITDDHVDGVGCGGSDLRDHLLDEADVDLGKVDAGLTGLAADARGDDDDVGILGIFVLTAVDVDIAAERQAVSDVHHFAFGFFLVNIDQNDLTAGIQGGQGVRDGRAHIACAQNRDFLTVFYLFSHKSHLL